MNKYKRYIFLIMTIIFIITILILSYYSIIEVTNNTIAGHSNYEIYEKE